MSSLWNYLFPEPPKQLLITFGKWHNRLAYLDYYYHGIITRLIEFAREAGVDKHDRYYNFEPLVDFAMENKITHQSADYIYRHYGYSIIARHQPINVDEEELLYLYNQFTLLPDRESN